MSGSRVYSLLLLCGLLLSVRLRAQTLHVCENQVEHSTCELVCITPDQTQTIAFFKLTSTDTEIAQCISGVGCFNTNPYTISQPNATATVLTFVLTRSLIGLYRCNYGSLSSTEPVHWGTYPSRSSITGVTNGSEIESVDEFMVSLHCFYSEDDPTITLLYKDEQGNVDATSDLFSCTNSTNSSCLHDSDFTSYDCSCRLRHISGIECTDIYDVKGYITISNIESMWNTSIVDHITFKCTSSSRSKDGAIVAILICVVIAILLLLLAIIIFCCTVPKGPIVMTYYHGGDHVNSRVNLFWKAPTIFCVKKFGIERIYVEGTDWTFVDFSVRPNFTDSFAPDQNRRSACYRVKAYYSCFSSRPLEADAWIAFVFPAEDDISLEFLDNDDANPEETMITWPHERIAERYSIETRRNGRGNWNVLDNLPTQYDGDYQQFTHVALRSAQQMSVTSFNSNGEVVHRSCYYYAYGHYCHDYPRAPITSGHTAADLTAICFSNWTDKIKKSVLHDLPGNNSRYHFVNIVNMKLQIRTKTNQI